MESLVLEEAYIIEDDPDLAYIFGRALDAAEYRVTAFESVEAAQPALTDRCPALIVLDLNLPGMSGVEFLHLIKSDTHLAATKVVIVSANHLLAETTRELADLVLIKPIAFNQLRDLVRRLKES